MSRRDIPEIERHISTQANNTNYGTYNFWYKQGASRVVSAGELSMEEIKENCVQIFRQIWKLRRLSTEQCVFPIWDGAFE